jgi:hypothetical protein
LKSLITRSIFGSIFRVAGLAAGGPVV